MKIIDVSLPLHEGMVVWPGDEPFRRVERKGTAIVSRLDLSTHTGTHIDAPKHFLFKKSGVERIALSKFIGRAKVIAVAARKFIEVRHLQKLKIIHHDKILFKTRNIKLLKQKRFTADYVCLSLAAAKYLVSKKVDLVGTDYYGIEAKGTVGHPVHKTLLRAGVVIVEGLDLSKVRPGTYNLAALPLKIVGADGSPARVILW